MRFRLFFMALAFAALLAAPGLNRARAASLIVSNGMLQGADGVDVGGAFYDVRFTGDTCIAAFNGCTSSAQLDFHDEASARLAAQALIDQVLIDGPAGNFDSQPDRTRGCIDTFTCYSFIPFSLINFGPVSVVSNIYALNYGGAPGISSQIGLFQFYDRNAFSTNANYVRFTPAAATVAEPSALALLAGGLALAGFVGRRRRR